MLHLRSAAFSHKSFWRMPYAGAKTLHRWNKIPHSLLRFLFCKGNSNKNNFWQIIIYSTTLKLYIYCMANKVDENLNRNCFFCFNLHFEWLAGEDTFCEVFLAFWNPPCSFVGYISIFLLLTFALLDDVKHWQNLIFLSKINVPLVKIN